MKLFDKIPLAFASFASLISKDVTKKSNGLTRRSSSFNLPSQNTELAYLKRSKSSLGDFSSDPFSNNNEDINNDSLDKFLKSKKQAPQESQSNNHDKFQKRRPKRLKEILELNSDDNSIPP